MHSKSRPYVSYLLRMWQAQGVDKPVWRISLENPHTGEKFFFASLPRLFQFLLNSGMACQAGSDPTDDHAGRVDGE